MSVCSFKRTKGIIGLAEYILLPVAMWQKVVLKKNILARLKNHRGPEMKCSHNGCGRVFGDGDTAYSL